MIRISSVSAYRSIMLMPKAIRNQMTMHHQPTALSDLLRGSKIWINDSDVNQTPHNTPTPRAVRIMKRVPMKFDDVAT